MRLLGLLFILGGLFLCFTILFWFPGLLAIGVGALLYRAGAGAPSVSISTTSTNGSSRPSAPASRVRRVSNGSVWVFVMCAIALAAIAWVGLAFSVKPNPKPGTSVVSHRWEAPPVAKRAKSR